MRAILCSEWGGPSGLILKEIAKPGISLGSVRVKVFAAGVNFADLLLIKGSYQVRPELPFSPGLEVAGVVTEKLGENISFEEGDRVIGLMDYGGFSEEVIVNSNALWRIPDSMDFDQAAAFPVVYGTSHIGLRNKLALRPGETLLVNGAASGVGLAAVEIAKLMGVRVIASAGSPEKLEIASKYGADDLIDYNKDNLRSHVKTLTEGKGVDAIFDPVGGKIFDESLRCVRVGGRILVVGFASGAIPKIPANILLVKNITVIGYYWAAHLTLNPELFHDSFAELFSWFQEGRIAPNISHRYPLAEASEAMNTLIGRKAKGKVVLLLRGGKE